MRLILDGTVVRVRLDRKATSISLLVVIGVRADGQKMLLAIKSIGGREHGSLARGPRRPDQAWSAATAVPRSSRRAGIGEGACCRLGGRTGTAMHRAEHRNLLAHAPSACMKKVTADYTDMIYAATKRKSRPAAKPSSASGGCATVPSPHVWRKPAIACSALRAFRQANGEAREQRTRSNVYTKS